uniref:Uncharacterized protein n=1 Tax=Acrobeloides nanus TaxID=290746 RepID=A0A914CUK8_9BILA
MDGVSFPTIQFVKQLKFICESRIKAIEYHSRGWYQANAAVLASYIDAVQVFLSMNEYEMRTLFRSSSSTLRQIPDSVTHVELNFQQFYESSYTDEFVPFLIQNPLNNGDNYTITLRGFEDFARRISYVDFVDLCDQILRAYENSKTPKNMIQKIILDNLGIYISQNFMRTRKYELTNLCENDFNTVEIYEVKLAQNCSITLLFQRICEGETSYRVTFEVKYKEIL